MKKFYFLFLLAIIASFSQAQNFTKVWSKLCNGTDFHFFHIGANLNNVVGIAYNPVTNKVLMSLRNTRIYVLNAATGALEDSLSTTGLGAESFKHNKIRCTSDGVIYGISLATGAGTCKIYRWANQAAAPTECASFSVTERTGDTFGLSGSGNGTILYASGAALAGGSSNTNVYVLTTVNGTNFLNTATISVPSVAEQWTNRSVDPIGTATSNGLWVDMSGGPARRLSICGSAPSLSATVAFTTTAGYNAGQVADSYCGMRYLQTPGNRKYLAFAGVNNSGDGVVMRMIEVTNEAMATTVGTDTLYSGGSPFVYQTNGNGTGDLDFKANGNGSYDIFYLATNNGIACVRSATTLPVELVSFNDLLFKNNVKLNWATANEINNSGFEIEKSIDGERFKSIGFIKALGNATNNYEFEDVNAANGKSLKLFYRLKQVDKDGKFTYTKVEVVNLPVEKVYTLSSFENPITNEIRLLVGTNKETNLTISITNSNGQIVSTKNIQAKQSNSTITLPAISFAKGLYYVTATDGITKQTLSIMKN